MRTRSARLLAGLVATLALTACGGANHPTGSGGGTGAAATSPGAAATGGYAVTVHVGGRTERLDPARLAALPAVTVSTPASDGATEQSGPTLTSVLGAAGVTTFAALHVVGPSESLDLAPADVTPQLVLALTKRGTAKLAGPGVAPSKWVRDVTDIEVSG